MTAPEISLDKAKTIAKEKRNFRASDFLSEDEQKEIKKNNAKGKASLFNAVDAYAAEILARFGYDAYMAWKAGDISNDRMQKFILAERARDSQVLFPLENIIVASMAGANNPTRGGHTPKSLQVAIKILKQEQEKANGK